MSVSKCKKDIPHLPIQWEHLNLFIKLSRRLMKTEVNQWGQLQKKLYVSEKTIRRNVHEDIRYKSYMMKRGQFIAEKSKENYLNRSKRLLNSKILQKQEWMDDNLCDHITPTFGLLTLQISIHWTIMCGTLLRRRLMNIPITSKTF